MDQNEKIPNDKYTKLENEIKVLKNEVQAVLLDLRESYLNMENPFKAVASPTAVQPIVINTERTQASEPLPAPSRQDKPKQMTAPPEDNSEDEQRPEVKSAKTPGLCREAGQLISPEKETHFEREQVSELNRRMVRESLKQTPEIHPLARIGSARPPDSGAREETKLDLITVAGLASWVELSTKKIGRERTEAILEISELMGHVSKGLKPVLNKLISLEPQASIPGNPRTRDYIDSLIKLNSLLGEDIKEENALLLLSMVSEANNG